MRRRGRERGGDGEVAGMVMSRTKGRHALVTHVQGYAAWLQLSATFNIRYFAYEWPRHARSRGSVKPSQVPHLISFLTTQHVRRLSYLGYWTFDGVAFNLAGPLVASWHTAHSRRHRCHMTGGPGNRRSNLGRLRCKSPRDVLHIELCCYNLSI